MSISLHKKVLVLDKNYQPIRIVNLRGAIYLVFREAANVIDRDYNVFNLQEWIRHSELRYNVDCDFKALRSVDSAFGVPDVVILKNFKQKQPRISACTKNNIILRDLYTCQYCSKKLTEDSSTIDHVIPTSKGGLLSWENAVTSCRECNNKKGDKDLDKCELKLLNKPKPLVWDHNYFRKYAEKFHNKTWNQFLGRGK